MVRESNHGLMEDAGKLDEPSWRLRWWLEIPRVPWVAGYDRAANLSGGQSSSGNFEDNVVFSKLRGTFFVGPYNKDCFFWGGYLGVPLFRQIPFGQTEHVASEIGYAALCCEDLHVAGPRQKAGYHNNTYYLIV